MFDVYMLLENQVRDIYHALSQKILTDKKKAPKWSLDTIGDKEIVEDLAPLLGLVDTFRKLSDHYGNSPEPSAPMGVLMPEESEKG